MDGGCTVYDSQSACCIICTEPTSGDCGVMNGNGIIPSWWRAFSVELFAVVVVVAVTGPLQRS